VSSSPSAAAAGAAGSAAGQQQQQQQQQSGRKHTAPRGDSSSVPLSLHLAQQRWAGCWVWWLLVHFVLPLLRNSFYVTESEPYRQAVFYYR
jgi:hypothetical protein